jgi:hypothetical protein
MAFGGLELVFAHGSLLPAAGFAEINGGCDVVKKGTDGWNDWKPLRLHH